MKETQHTVLVVDDNPANLGVLFNALRHANYRVLIAENGESVFTRLARVEPDIILLDIMMPDIDGFETCRRLKADPETKHIPVIFMTALTDPIDEVKGLALGAVDYITKPIQVDTVLARLKTHLTLRHLRRELERKNQELSDSRERYRLMAQYATDIIARQNPAGVYEYVSPACKTLLGYSPEEMLGRTAYEFFAPEDLADLQEIYGQSWPVDETITYRARRKDGSLVWLESSSTLIPESQAIIVVSRDVNKRKQAEETLQLAHDELKISNAELDTFAHMVAHDLKNPLSALMGYSEYLLEEIADSDKQANTPDFAFPAENAGILRRIFNLSRKMLNIVEELLILTGVRKQNIVSDWVDMGTVVNQVLHRYNYLLDEHQATYTLPDDWPLAHGYAPWLEEVWANYLSNALKYGGTPPKLIFGATPLSDGRVKYWLKDNGNGIAPAEQDSLFTEFTRLTKLHVEGHGLGLSIVQRIINKIGGDVGVESSGLPNEGATFYFILPGEGFDFGE